MPLRMAARQGGGGALRPAVWCWPPTPSWPPAGASCPRRRPSARGPRLPDPAVRPPPSRADRGRAGRPRTAARTERLVDSVVTFNRLTDAADRAPISPAASGEGKAGGYAINGHAASVRPLPVRQLLRRGRAAAVRDRAAAARRRLAGAVTVSIRAATSPGEVRVAVVDGNRLLDYALWRPGAPDGVGDLHRGRVIAACSGDGRGVRGSGRCRGLPARQRGRQGPHRRHHPGRARHPSRAGRQGPAADRARDPRARCRRRLRSADQRVRDRGADGGRWPPDEVRTPACCAAAPTR